jgi:hypothetical protein
VACLRLGNVTVPRLDGARLALTLQDPVAVIPAVIPPGTTRKTGGDQADGTVDLSSKDDTRFYLLDGGEATHNRSVAGSRPASPTEQDKQRPADGGQSLEWRSFFWSFQSAIGEPQADSVYLGNHSDSPAIVLPPCRARNGLPSKAISDRCGRHRDLGVLGGLLQYRHSDYCGGCQAASETLPSGRLAPLLDRGQGGAAPYFYPHPGGIPLAYLPRWADRAAVGVEVEEGLT